MLLNSLTARLRETNTHRTRADSLDGRIGARRRDAPSWQLTI
jgi:hypothetical protein